MASKKKKKNEKQKRPAPSKPATSARPKASAKKAAIAKPEKAALPKAEKAAPPKAAKRKAAPPKALDAKPPAKAAARKAAAAKAPASKAPSQAPSNAPPAEKPEKKSKAARVNEIVHWEIQSQDPAKLHKFYAEALGWKIDANNPMQYGMVSSKGSSGINGGIGGSEASGSRVVVYAAVPSIDAALKRIESKGGTTIMPRTDLGMVIMALYQDPEGNTMGLVEGDGSSS